MLGLSVRASIGLICFFAAFVAFMLVSPKKAKAWLSQDMWGFAVSLVGLFVISMISFLRITGDWSVAAVAIGSFVAGAGFLIGLPDFITDRIITRLVLGILLFVGSVGVVIYYVFIPLTKPAIEAFGAFWAHTSASQGLWLVIATVMVIAGVLFIYLFKGESK